MSGFVSIEVRETQVQQNDADSTTSTANLSPRLPKSRRCSSLNCKTPGRRIEPDRGPTAKYCWQCRAESDRARQELVYSHSGGKSHYRRERRALDPFAAEKDRINQAISRATKRLQAEIAAVASDSALTAGERSARIQLLRDAAPTEALREERRRINESSLEAKRQRAAHVSATVTEPPHALVITGSWR